MHMQFDVRQYHQSLCDVEVTVEIFYKRSVHPHPGPLFCTLARCFCMYLAAG